MTSQTPCYGNEGESVVDRRNDGCRHCVRPDVDMDAQFTPPIIFEHCDDEN